jgi:lipopolysaccharide/colanic/teichoic acid biosynthesis glycosyltransferase
VLTGEMSVVGPRPERPFFVRDYYEFQGRRLSVKPGVTGLAAVNSRYYLRLVDKVTYDYYYLDNYSLVLDLKIVIQTVWVLLFESNKALQDQHHEMDCMKIAPAEDQNNGESNGN